MSSGLVDYAMLCLHQNEGQQDGVEVNLDFLGDVDQQEGVEVRPMPFSVSVPCYLNFPYLPFVLMSDLSQM